MLSGGPLMLVVLLFVALAIAIYVISRNVKNNKEAISLLKSEKAASAAQTAEKPKTISASDSDEEAAAFMALHLYLSQSRHDEESNVLTIDRIQKRYSPWSSKIYSMNNILHR